MATENLSIRDARNQLGVLQAKLFEAKEDLLDDIETFIDGDRVLFRAFVSDLSEIGKTMGFAPLKAVMRRSPRPKPISPPDSLLEGGVPDIDEDDPDLKARI